MGNLAGHPRPTPTFRLPSALDVQEFPSATLLSATGGRANPSAFAKLQRTGPLTRPAHCHINAATNGAHGA